jgi:D-alanyl-D-alanine carboxypeptidase
MQENSGAFSIVLAAEGRAERPARSIGRVNRAGLQRRMAGAWRVARREPAPRLRVTADRLAGPQAGRVEAAVSEALERVRPPGAQLAVRRRGTLVWAACAGRADRSAPVGPEDRFVLASATKLATACLVAQLAERGVLGLDDPVATWLPELPHAGRLTPRLLLAHRSGLREYLKDRALAPRLNGGAPDHPWTRGEVIAAIARLGPEREPDQRFRYCNSNYVVAAELAERASGEDYETLLEAQIAGPLGLPGFSCARSIPGTRLATPHLALLRRPVDLLAVTRGRVPTDAIGPVWGDGGIASSALDLARFTEALFGGELVSARTLGAMTARTSRFGRKAGYGLGVMCTRVPGAVVAGHDGVYFGWTASTGIDDATATTVSAVANLAGPSVPAARLAKAARAAL